VEGNKESGICDSCEQTEQSKINGILYLPALGLILGLPVLLYTCFYLIKMLAQIHQQTGQINTYGIGIIIVIIVQIAITLTACWCFFKKLKRTRYIMIAYYLLGLGFTFYCTWFPAILFDFKLDDSGVKAMGRSLISCVIWVPYFIFSKRINKVFVH